jgi:hypothetical protein
VRTALLLESGLELFFDQNRGDEEEKVPWETWMEDKILEANHVLMVCTELYRKNFAKRSRTRCVLGSWFHFRPALPSEAEHDLPVVFSPADKRLFPSC